MMPNGKRLKREDYSVSLSTSPSEPVRQTLPRRCKGVQPYYGIDNYFEDDDNDCTTTRKKREVGSSSSGLKEKIGNAGQGQRGRPPKKTLAVTSDKQTEEKEETTYWTILSWIVDMKVVKQEEEVIICVDENATVVVGRGIITREGILCRCCNGLFTVPNFVIHRSDLSADKSYQKIFIKESGVSLLTCQIEAWNRHSVPARDGYHHVVRRPRVRDHHDDSCLVCADGGDLMCCEKCPSTYHPKCMGFQGVPRDEWHCPYCHCKHCDRDASAGLLLTCFQCLKKYHLSCCPTNDKTPFHLDIPFCGKSCWQLYRALERMVGRSVSIRPGLSWMLVRRMDIQVGGTNCDDLHRRATCNSMVALAAKLMEDSFKLIVDRQTRTNMIQSVVYSCGSNFTRTNFSRFYTAVLELEGQIVTVASLRMPSSELTEIPFIATAESWRNRGMCKQLLSSIELALTTELSMERIIIPSAEDMVRNWQTKFGFIPIDENVEREIARLNTLMFPKTTRLQKVLTKRIMIVNDLNFPPEEEEED